jgi:hypothetical protein
VVSGAARHLAALAALGVLAACERAGEPTRAPTTLRAEVVAEPPELRVGEVGTLEIAVVTPPGHGVRPLEPPRDLSGVWLLDAQRLPVEKQPWRWIHRTRLRIRPHEVGALTWPGGSAEVEAPDGSVSRVAWEAVPLEVVSVLPEFPDRLTPFGARVPEPEPAAPGRLAAALGGALLTLAGVGVLALLRRSRTAPIPAAPPGEPADSRARAVLARARAALEADPIAAADAAAGALRRYAAARFGADTVSRTSEELALLRPPFAATTRWPALLSILEALDDLRFRPAGGGGRAALVERVRGLLDAAQRFVQETAPGGPTP